MDKSTESKISWLDTTRSIASISVVYFHLNEVFPKEQQSWYTIHCTTVCAIAIAKFFKPFGFILVRQIEAPKHCNIPLDTVFIR